MKNFHTIDIRVIFDISSPMEYIFSLFKQKDYRFNGLQILEIIEKICLRGESTKNKIIRLFSIISGGENDSNFKAIDLCKLVEIIKAKLDEFNDRDKKKEKKYICRNLMDFVKKLDIDNIVKNIKSNDFNNIIENVEYALNNTILESKISKRKKAEFLNGNDLMEIVDIILNHSKNLKKIDLKDLKLNILMDNIIDKSPLENAIHLAIETFIEKNFNFLFIITSRDIKNSNNLNEIINKKRDKNTIILTFFLTDKKIN